MRDIYPEYFVNQNLINFNNLDSSVLVVLDTNILLDLYRYSPMLKKKFMNSIKKTEKNLWMPYQVGFEFNRNRKSIIYDVAEEKKNFIPNLSKQVHELIDESVENFKKKYKMFEELIESSEMEYKQLTSLLNEYFENMEKKINTKRSDDILPFIEEVFMGKIASNELYNYSEWEKEAIDRYEMKKPPGYKDYAKKKENYYYMKEQRVCAAYGDFFMWKEILEKSKDDSIKEVVLVTRDVKEDWFYETKGKKIGARVELIEELLRVSNANFRIFTNETFLLNTTTKTEFKSVEKEVQESVVRSELTELYNLIDRNTQTVNNKTQEQLLLNLDLEENFNKGKDSKVSNFEILEKIVDIEKVNKEISFYIIDINNRLMRSSVYEIVQKLTSDFKMYETDFKHLRNLFSHNNNDTENYVLFTRLNLLERRLHQIKSELNFYLN